MNPMNYSNPPKTSAGQVARKRATRVPAPMQRRDRVDPTVVMARVIETEPLPEQHFYTEYHAPDDTEPLPPPLVEDTLPPQPPQQPQVVAEPHPPADPYMELYAQYIRLQEENLRLRRKTMRLEEDLKCWSDKKVKKRAKLEGEELKNAIIDIILNSGMNIESIPDDVERELYGFILTQLSNGAGAVSCVRRLFFCG